MDCSFVLLSGGNSKRFIEDKTISLLYGKPMYRYGLECGLSISSDVIHISKNSKKYKPFMENVKYIEDELEVVCPMSGLIEAGKQAKYDYIFVLSVDSPLITGKFFKYLYNNINSFDGVMPVINNKIYPLISFYRRHVLLSMENDYNNRDYKLLKSIEKHNILYIKENEIVKAGFSENMFININYQDDLKKLEEQYE